MQDAIRKALATDRVIDITTIGRTSHQPRRIEIWFHQIDGRIYITGLPGKRDWYANLLANPAFTFHLKESIPADLAARALPISDPVAKRQFFIPFLTDMDQLADLELRVAQSPLVEVVFDLN